MASKAYMAREGLWYGLDAALTWHPGDSSEVTTGSTNSCIQMIYTFHGLASQASTAPERGRSALDAVELMNVGVQFLREHMPRDARVHYSILDAGGVSPNVVQHQASVLYMIRSNFVKDCMALHQRVDKIAQGAALMTDTTIERRFVDGLSDTVCNHALEKVLYDNFSQLGVPPCTAEEHAFMEALSATYEGRDVPGGVGAENDPAFAEKVKAMQTGHFNDFLMPLYQGPAFNAGSTDVGDVSYQCPTAQIHVAVWPNHVPCHSWQVVSCNKTPMAHKATVHAGKVLCAAAIDLLEQPELLAQAMVWERRPLQLLRDLYSTSCLTQVQTEELALTQLVDRSVRTQSVRELLETAAPAHSAVDCWLSLGQVEQQREGDGVNVTQIQLTALYLNDEGQLQSVQRAAQAVCRVECPQEAECRVRCRWSGEMFAALAAGGVEVRCSLDFFCTVLARQSVTMAVRGELGEKRAAEAGEQPSVVLRLAAPGERLWDIAKAYGTTREEIRLANGLEEDETPEHTMLLIPRVR